MVRSSTAHHVSLLNVLSHLELAGVIHTAICAAFAPGRGVDFFELQSVRDRFQLFHIASLGEPVSGLGTVMGHRRD